MRHEPTRAPAGLGLQGLQVWLQTAIRHQDGSVRDAADRASVVAGRPDLAAEDVALASPSLSGADRVQIYRRMYLARLVEALEDDYSAVRHHLGPEAFRQLVADYAAGHPSRSYTLARFGDRLPQYLAEHAPPARRDFLADLARFEAALNRAFDAEPAERLSRNAIRKIPLERWPETRLVPAPAVELLRLEHEVTSHFQAAQEDLPLPEVERRETFVAVYRRDWTARWIELSAPAFDVLSALVEGADLVAALARGVEALEEGESETAVFEWFSEWFGEGLFSAVEHAPR